MVYGYWKKIWLNEYYILEFLLFIFYLVENYIYVKLVEDLFGFECMING